MWGEVGVRKCVWGGGGGCEEVCGGVVRKCVWWVVVRKLGG